MTVLGPWLNQGSTLYISSAVTTLSVTWTETKKVLFNKMLRTTYPFPAQAADAGRVQTIALSALQ